MEEVQLVVPETDELESQEEPYAHASFGILSWSRVHEKI